MDTLFDYGLTPRSFAAIAFGITALALAMWGAYRWRAQREKKAKSRQDNTACRLKVFFRPVIIGKLRRELEPYLAIKTKYLVGHSSEKAVAVAIASSSPVAACGPVIGESTTAERLRRNRLIVRR